MNSKPKSSSMRIGLFIALICIFPSFGQVKKDIDTLVSSYAKYTESPREISYAHLNKTAYAKGEMMGFAIYIFDKDSKQPATSATNIYCTISNKKNEIVKSEMLLANNGVANGSFEIDSVFNSGEYTFRAYTNWMRNFEEPNYFTQTFKVIDPETDNQKTTMASHGKLDAQFLPEGGHLVAEVDNSVGVIIKDSMGFGVPEISGKVLDSNNNTLTNFETNTYGIGKFTFYPELNNHYRVVLNYNGTEQVFPIAPSELIGIALTMNDMEDQVALSFRTNQNTLKQIKEQEYVLTIHNGNSLKVLNFSFGKATEVLQTIRYDDLNPGINIFTLFDKNNNPILERLFFNYNGIDLFSAPRSKITKSEDSIAIQMAFKNLDLTEFNNLSVSVLPEGSKSYHPNNNIISAIYLQPYIRSYVEDAGYYFTDINRKKKFELDQVLLTQGWSSYDWNTVFKHPPKIQYPYENGISFKANLNKKKTPQYMMYATINNEMQVFEIDEGEKDFGAIGLFPMDSEKIRFSAVKRNRSIQKPALYLQFFPSTIPDLNQEIKEVPFKDNIAVNLNFSPIQRSGWEEAEELEAVVVTTDKVLTREDKLMESAFGHVDVLNDDTRRTYVDFPTYIRTKGFFVYEAMGSVVILSPRPVSLGQRKEVRIYLDNIPLLNADILYKYSMENVDYVYYDKIGRGEGGTGANGVIKIYTDPSISQSKMERNVSLDVAVPLSFSRNKKFYAPKYSSYHSQFYREYGVMDWFPKLKIDTQGIAEFKILEPSVKRFNLFIEGVANNGSLISEQITVEAP